MEQAIPLQTGKNAGEGIWYDQIKERRFTTEFEVIKQKGRRVHGYICGNLLHYDMTIAEDVSLEGSYLVGDDTVTLFGSSIEAITPSGKSDYSR